MHTNNFTICLIFISFVSCFDSFRLYHHNHHQLLSSKFDICCGSNPIYRKSCINMHSPSLNSNDISNSKKNNAIVDSFSFFFLLASGYILDTIFNPIFLKHFVNTPLATVRLLSPLPLSMLLAYIPCLWWGIPWARIGSWKSLKSNLHRIGGVLTLLIPLAFSIWEIFTSSHVPLPLYILCVITISTNVFFGAALIPSRLPAYDIPTLRAFAVGCLLAASFTTMSLYFRLGCMQSYEIFGKIFALGSVFSTIYAWSDGIQHLISYLKGNYKEDIGRKWYLPFERPTMKHVFVDCLWKQPSESALKASVSPSNMVTAFTTLLTAVFATISLLQLRYLSSGVAGMTTMAQLYPDIVRWSCYEALLAVVANNFGTFSGTLVLQNKVSQKTAGMFNAVGLLIPVLNLLGFCVRYPGAINSLITTSFCKL